MNSDFAMHEREMAFNIQIWIYGLIQKTYFLESQLYLYTFGFFNVWIIVVLHIKPYVIIIAIEQKTNSGKCM